MPESKNLTRISNVFRTSKLFPIDFILYKQFTKFALTNLTMRHFILAFLLISLSGFSQTISIQVVGPAGAATFERGLSTSLCEGSSGNQLVNPSFEVPSVTNIGNNFLTWPINGWNGVGSAPNFVKVNGVAGQGGPISAQEGVQYLDIVAGSADFYQEFDFQCNTQVFFSGYFSVRDGLTSTGRIDILRVNSDNTTDIVASSNQLNMPSTANIWYLASGDAVLPAGNYRFNISMGNHSNFDSACFSFDNPNTDTGSYGPLCESSSITLTGTPTDSFGSWTGSGIVDNGDGTASFNPSGLGGTAVTVTYSHFDASGFGCSQSTNIEVNPNITPTFTQVPAICSGDTLSDLLTTSNNGITGTWSPSLDTTATTTYAFTPDAGQCATAVNMTITVNPNVTPTFTQVPAICFGDTLSDLLTTSNNGITGTWSPSLDTTATTTYAFTPDAGQCAATVNMTIAVNPNVTPTFTQVPAICSGDALSELLTTSNNGITGTWSPSLDTTATTTYAFTPDAGQCAATVNMTIAVNPNVIPTFTQVAAIFNGETLGALPTTSNNGVTGIWSPAINNTETTTYTFTPDDSEACAINQTMTISVNTIPFSVAVNSEIICSSGIATLVATPSPAGFYSYTWIVPEGVSNPGNVQSFSTSIEGDYSVSISKDNYLCNTDFEENQLGILGSYSIVHQDTVPCWETTASDSQIEVWGDEMNGIAAYSGNQFIELNANMQSTLFQNFEIIPGSSVILSFAHRGRNSSADDIMEVEIGPIGGPYTNLGAFSDGIDSWGYYSLEYVLPDDLGINYTIRFKSIQPAGSLGNFLDDISVVFPSDVSSEIATGNVSIITEITPTFTQIPEICSGDALSALLTTSNNGITGAWSPSLDTTTTTTYSFTPDADQCATVVNMTIAVNPNITPTFTQILEICDGDALSELLTTSNNGITGTWSPATTTNTYTFTPDVGQCATVVNMTIAVNPNVTPTFTQIPEICSGGALSELLTTSNNGITGTWSPSLDTTATTTYAFTPDAGQCATAVNMTITVNPNVTPTFTQVPAICFGDTLSDLLTTSNNGITGTWSPSLDTTTTTTYSFTPDADQCATVVNMTIAVNPNITPTFTQILEICDGDALSDLLTTSNNGITGTWSPSLDTTATTTYSFTPDVGQCATAVNMTIAVNPNVTPTFTQIPAICSGGALSDLLTTSNNGITGTWSPSLDTTATTTYRFTPDAGQCATAVNMTITVNPNVTPTFTQIPAICDGDALAVLPTTSNNGITGTWTPALDTTTTTTYTFTPTARLCANPATLIIVVNPIVDPVFDAVDAICVGDALAVLPTTSNDGITGAWTPALDTTTTTTYTFTPDLGECANPATLTIVVNPIVDPVFDAVDAICDGDFLAALPTTSNNGVSGTWSPALDTTTTTTYTFTPDLGECANPATLIIVVNPLVDPVFDAVDAICDGDALAVLPITSNNGITGTWSPALDTTTTTTYTFTPTARLCANPATLTIVVNPKVNPLFTAVDAICDGDALAVLPTTSNDGITGAWTPALDNTTTTTYTFTPNADECADPTIMTVVVIPVNVLTISAINLSEEFDTNQVVSVTASGGSGSYEYQLDNGLWQFSSVFEYVTGCGEHTVVVRDAIDTCNTEPETTVSIMEYPKFFTPNGDGFNDTWNIKCLKDNPLARIRIYDRYGKLLLDFRPSQNAWNGTFNGQRLPGTDYWFVANYLNSNGLEAQLKSHFSLRY